MSSQSLTGLFLQAISLAWLGTAVAGQPFAIQVTDESSHRGIPMVALETDNHIRLVTDSGGWAVFDEPGLMGRTLHFSISSPGYELPKDADGQPGEVLTTASGQSAEIKMVRTTIAERLYRLTGQGVYRDSTLLGKDVPLPFPNINGDVLSLGRAQVSPYLGKLLWVWSDARLASPGSSLMVIGAAADLPGMGGLNPTVGVHLRYFTSEQDETLCLLKAPPGLQASIDGLISVKDTTGAEHVLAHYVFATRNGRCSEQGIAEFNGRHVFERKVVLGEEYTWQFPMGHAVEVSTEAGAYLYFATPFCHTRVPAKYEAALSPTSYESLAWSSADNKVVWQQGISPITQAEETHLVRQGKIKRADAHCQLICSMTNTPLELTEGSVQWNDFRKRWIMIGNGPGNAQSPGDVWYAEAADVTGPWTTAIQIATHATHAFAGPSQLAELQQEGGRFVYFEGSLNESSTSTAESFPRYQDNQLMYRLDVDDPRLAPAHGSVASSP